MSRDASMRTRQRRNYSFGEYGGSETSQRQGNYLIKQNMADLWSPAYGQGVTTIRIFPALSPETGTWEPYRWPSDDPYDPLKFSDFIRRYSAVRSMGDPGVTFIQLDPTNPQVEDAQMTPAWLLFRAIDRAVATGQDRQGWASLLRGGAGRGAMLPKPTEVYLVQGVIMSYKGRAYSPPKGFGAADKTVVIELGHSAGQALVQELNREREGYTGNPDDFEARYANGDPISLQGGRFVSFYTLKDGDPRQAQQQVASGWQGIAAGGQAGGQRNDPIGYGCFMEPNCGPIPARLAEYESLIRQKVRQWDDLLYFPTIEQQAALLADKFPPEVIMYAWSGHPEWIPEEVRRRAVGAVSLAMPGMPGMPGMPVAHGMGVAAGPAMGGWQQGMAAPYQSPYPAQSAFPPQQVPSGMLGGAALAAMPLQRVLAPMQQLQPPTQPLTHEQPPMQGQHAQQGMPAVGGWGVTPDGSSHHAAAAPQPTQQLPPVTPPQQFAPPPQQFAPPPQQQFAPPPQQFVPPQQQFAPPPQQFVPPPQQQAAQPAAMGWGMQPNAVATPPVHGVTDTALVPGSIPPSAAPVTAPPAQQVMPAGMPQMAPPQQFAPPPTQAAGFDQVPPAPVTPAAGQSPAAIALARAQAAARR